ncbi:MAG: hypothetical protein A3F68_00590 [Acidobacteria bacterium RIFCSPLOWO2_12_FULL_54_10]|nr:MAG: hypothetical protein A3F68_00590 [Acidobacteria bacterium RIFCSPLOWO2_12_FULL_54_10]
MNAHPQDSISLASRVEKLERQNRRMKQAATAACILVAAVIFLGQSPAPGRSVEAQEFVLTDSNGTARARLGLRSDVPGLILYDESGEKARAFLGVVGDGPGLYLSDADGKVRAMLKVTENQPAIVLSDTDGFKTQIGHSILEAEDPADDKETSAATVVLSGQSQTLVWDAK